MSGCHSCELFGPDTVKPQTSFFMARCCKKRCSNRFCIDCIRAKFDPNFQVSSYKPDTWICYSCQSLCSCLLCKGIGSQKKTYKKKNTNSNKIAESYEPDSSIVTIKSMDGNENYFKEEEMANKPLFMRRILERKNLMYRLMFEAEEKGESKGELEQKLQKEKKQEKPQNERKVQKTMGKDSSKLQQMIRETMKEYEDDDLDIELLS